MERNENDSDFKNKENKIPPSRKNHERTTDLNERMRDQKNEKGGRNELDAIEGGD